MVTRSDVTGVLLAGGRSRRLGRDKALEPFCGEPLIARTAARLADLCGELLVVVADLQQRREPALLPKARVVADLLPGRGSLGGIYTGLHHASNQWAVVAACDMPFLSTALLVHMLALRQGSDAVVPVVGGRPEPTHALYSRACLPAIRSRVERGLLKIAGFFEDVQVTFVPEDEVRRHDPDLLSFLNINSQADLDRALALAREGR